MLYNIFLFLIYLIALPRFLLRKRGNLAERFGKNLPDIPSTGKRIWIHAISMGETRAVIPFLELLRKDMPDACIFISSTTETGHAEAKRSLPGLAGYFFLPLDFSWVMRRSMKKLKPDILLLVEGDFWYNMMKFAPKVILVNGKMSEKSARRFGLVPFFSKPLFSELDFLCVQSQRFADRFIHLGVDPAKIVVTGNLKFDMPLLQIDPEKWKKDLGIGPKDRVITIGSTHDPEEDMILTELEPLWEEFPTLKVILVPRHPERFEAVADLLKRIRIPFRRYSQAPEKDENPKVILIDAMGILNPCYRLSELAIGGGSFVDHIGGHNIFESVRLGVPVLFGPHMHSQKDLVDAILHAGAGQQVTIKELPTVVASFLREPSIAMQQACRTLSDEIYGATTRTWFHIGPLIK